MEDEEIEEVCQWCGASEMVPCKSFCYEMQRGADQEEELYS